MPIRGPTTKSEPRRSVTRIRPNERPIDRCSRPESQTPADRHALGPTHQSPPLTPRCQSGDRPRRASQGDQTRELKSSPAVRCEGRKTQTPGSQTRIRSPLNQSPPAPEGSQGRRERRDRTLQHSTNLPHSPLDTSPRLTTRRESRRPDAPVVISQGGR